ncbi:acyltransferase domain-containing protein [Ditylenchus destructor]|nr:acyltransferase domain-containing protein [Ditylenchus destructor]
MAEPPLLTTSTAIQKFQGILFSLTMVISGFFGSTYILIPLMPLMVFQPKLFRKLVDRLVGFWLIMPSGLMEYFFGVHLHVTGHNIDHTKPGLIIMNHRTRLDWLFFWNALFRMDPWLLTSEKISLKGVLKYMPGFGWAMASNVFMFLDRYFASDKGRIDSLIEYYGAAGCNYQLLLFPEGTDKCPKATERSRQYAEKNNLVHYDYLLHPRTTGFAYILQKMRKSNYVEYVYDVTVAYSDAIVQSEVDLVALGLCPKQVHFDIRKIPVGDLPETDEGLDFWLKKLWAEKEERLRKFYSQPHNAQRLDTAPDAQTYELTPFTRMMQILFIGIWLLATVSWVYFFLTQAYQGTIALVSILFYTASQYIYGGVEWLIIREALKKFSAQKKHS